MPFLFNDQLHVHYGQFYVESRTDDFFGELSETMGGQANGLCGAAVPGMLFLITGLRAGDTRLDEEPLLDRYLLQLWPAPAAPDAIIRETSDCATYWHAHASALPPPPSPEERAEAKRQEHLAREQTREEAARAAEERRWNGRPPSDRLKRVNGGKSMARLDRDLVAGIEQAEETTQRAIGRWVARRACVEAGLSDLDWVARALEALEQGAPLPFELTEAFEFLTTDARAPMTAVPSFDGRHDRVSRQYAALPAVWSAAGPDGLAVGVEALFHATVTFGDEYPRLFTELREAFPTLAH